jgi:hypothetical protein
VPNAVSRLCPDDRYCFCLAFGLLTLEADTSKDQTVLS